MIEFIVGVVVGAGLLLIVGGIANKLSGHEHTLEPRSLTPMIKKYSDGHKEAVTEVLYVCSCGHAETREFTGSWKLADFQVAPAKGEDKELERLRKMAGMEDSQ